MKQGLLWYDANHATDLAEKVQGAVRHYKKTRGTTPNVCYVHPSALPDGGPLLVGGVRVESLPTVLRGHFWVGVGEE